MGGDGDGGPGGGGSGGGGGGGGGRFGGIGGGGGRNGGIGGGIGGIPAGFHGGGDGEGCLFHDIFNLLLTYFALPVESYPCFLQTHSYPLVTPQTVPVDLWLPHSRMTSLFFHC